LSNEGAGISSKKVRFEAYIEDSRGEVIWSSYKDETLSLSTDSQSLIELPRPLEQWQLTYGCVGHIILDSRHTLYEKKKKNNESSFAFGQCKMSPSSENGDKYDFVPTISLLADGVVFKVKNQGTLPLINEFERLEYDISYHGA